MEFIRDLVNQGYHNFLFLGEAGSGKSEIAVNFAKYLNHKDQKDIHFFDMDMTKPLFRSRDMKDKIEESGIRFHHEEQFMDAPTLVGGVSRLLKNSGCYVVMDIGGDYIGARAVGGFAPLVNQPDTIVYYVLNPYRPWSNDIKRIDQVLGATLGAAHINIEQIRFISNPNLGEDTNPEEVFTGHEKISRMITPYKPLDFICIKEELHQKIEKKISIPIMPIKLYLKYLWDQNGLKEQE